MKLMPDERRADAADQERPDPVVDADARIGLDARVRRIAGPAGGRELADHQRHQDQGGARRAQPQAERVQEREGDVARADLQGNGDVHQPGHERHGHEEDHDRAVRAEDLVEMLGRQVAAVVQRHRLLGAHHDGVDEAAHQHDERQHDVHDADALVVDAGQPFDPQVLPRLEPGDDDEDDQRAAHRDQSAGRGDGAVERQGFDRQFAEHSVYLRSGAVGGALPRRRLVDMGVLGDDRIEEPGLDPRIVGDRHEPALLGELGVGRRHRACPAPAWPWPPRRRNPRARWPPPRRTGRRSRRRCTASCGRRTCRARWPASAAGSACRPWRRSGRRAPARRRNSSPCRR